VSETVGSTHFEDQSFQSITGNDNNNNTMSFVVLENCNQL